MSNKIEVVTDPDDADDVACVVCVRLTQPLVLPDNVIDICSRCGEAVQYGRDAPEKPPKVCIICIGPTLLQEMQAGTLQAVLTPKGLDAAFSHLRKKRAN